jgi:hypothetical protein
MIRATESTSSASVGHLAISTKNPACGTSALHLQPPPYSSTDPAVITGHILAAQAQCIDGFVVDWYGPPDGMPNDEDREFIDRAFDELLRQAEVYGFKVAIMYDEGTLKGAAPLTTTHVISDLLYATKYFTSSSYLEINDQPALFVFPYPDVDDDIDWQTVRQQLTVPVTLLDKDPDPDDLDHDDLFDGFYAWVQPTKPDGTEWGEEYLHWFYDTMADPRYSNKVAIGGVWPGFDDTLASWGSGRYIWRRCGQTWFDTWRLAEENNPLYMMIDTWNDFEEGTDIEHGIGECLAPPQSKSARPGTEVAYTHTLTNSGRFTDTFNLTAVSSRGWPVATSLSSVLLPGHISAPLTVTLTVPQGTSGCGQDMLVVTATSTLSSAIESSLTDTTTVQCTIYLPILVKPPWQEDFNPIQNTWMQISAIWDDVPGRTAILRENNPDTYFGKVESGIITMNVDACPILRVRTTAVDQSSSYTIQILDKQTDVPKDLLKDVTHPGEHAINIAQEMGWQGVRSFTINIWMSGEGKSATFDFLGFEADM